MIVNTDVQDSQKKIGLPNIVYNNSTQNYNVVMYILIMDIHILS